VKMPDERSSDAEVAERDGSAILKMLSLAPSWVNRRRGVVESISQ
jgi:hypothetical protein